MDYCSVAQGLGWGWRSKARDETPQQPPLSGSQSRPGAFTHILPVLTGKNVLTDKGYKAKNAMIQYNVFQVESLQNLHSNTKQ